MQKHEATNTKWNLIPNDCAVRCRIFLARYPCLAIINERDRQQNSSVFWSMNLYCSKIQAAAEIITASVKSEYITYITKNYDS